MAARSLFTRRTSLRPTEYPELLPYRDAIRHAYWLHSEFNLHDDVHDFRTGVTHAERQAITNATLAIAQVEVAVKAFWGDLMKRLPKPEIGAVGYTFAESEVRHQDAYAHLLHILGLDDAFERIHRVPALRRRIAVLDQVNDSLPPPGEPEADGREFAFSLVLFSSFVEHVSLFSQFLIMKSFQRRRGLFKGVSNVVDATSQEEQIHGLFGYELTRLLREERPGWFDDAFEARLRRAAREGFEAERAIVAWIYEAGELPFLPATEVEAFVQHRFDVSLAAMGYAPEFSPDPSLVARSIWFEEEILAGKHVDFFHKRPTSYAKKGKAFSADDLFATS
ncbi:MAG: ribonucleotide-diphosphate reductase subunit beta [Trueperaceae bacterium]|nr:ribonucleotide-diphosphate reductase subunit beta [Trueperaceae bacterium]